MNSRLLGFVDTHIPEKLADFVHDGLMDCELIDVESEHSAISTALGASAVGSRTFSATASQGLALMHEVLFTVSGMRLPVVMAVANRALSAPINIWNDHQDSVSARDSGWIQMYVESAQEAFDTVVMAYKVAEHRDVLTPAMVCLDGFTLTHVYEPVDIPSQSDVDSFLPKFKPLYRLDPESPVSMGPIGYPAHYVEFKKQQQEAMAKALVLIKKAHADWFKRFKRPYGDGLVELYKMDDAKFAVAAMGTVCSTAREVVDVLRRKGKKVGLIKVKTFRPFPEQDILAACKRLKGIAVLDKDISLGQHGSLFTDIRSCLHNRLKTNVCSFIVGLGGRDVTPKIIEHALLETMKSDKSVVEWL